MPAPAEQHAIWTRSLLAREPFDRFRKWYDPTHFNFRIAVCRPNRPGRACAWLSVPPKDFPEFAHAYTTLPNDWYIWVEENFEPPFRFFLDVDAHGRGFTAEELAEVLHAAMPLSDIWLLTKGTDGGESTRWHVVAEQPIHRSVASFREAYDALLEALGGSVLGRRLRDALDPSPAAQLRLRAPYSVKVYGAETVDPADKYRIVARVLKNGGMATYERDFPAVHNGFISWPGAGPRARVPNVAWKARGEVLPVPLFGELLPFDYCGDTLSPARLDKVVADVLADAAHDPEVQLPPDLWGTVVRAVVAHLDQYFAHVLGEGVFVVVPPKNVATANTPDRTMVLSSNTHRFYSHGAFMTCFGGIGTTLWPPHTKHPERIRWAKVWLEHADTYATSMQFSKPLAREDGDGRTPPRTFNLWTGPGISPHDAFAAVQRNPQRAKMVVDFFVDFLKNVICGDPFEDPVYNQYAFRLVLHLLVYCVKQPHDPFPAIFYMWSPEQGVGKGQFTNVLMNLIGVHNTFNTVGVNGVQGNFAGYVAEKLLLVLDEESDRKKQAEAYGLLKHLATDPLLTADKKFKDSETVNNFLKIVATSNLLWPIPIEDRRVFSLAVNPIHHRDTAYWNQYMDLVATGDGYRYIAAWLFGMKPNPDFKPGIVIPKGYVRVRQADRIAENLDPLQAVIQPWLSTATVDSIERFEAAVDVPCKRFLDDWFRGNEPQHHYNQPLLGQLVIDKAKLIEMCGRHGKYTTHHLKASVIATFGDKNAVLFPTQRTPCNHYTRVVWAAHDTFVEDTMAAMTKLIEEARPRRIGEDCVDGVWPIPEDRLRTFAECGVNRTPHNGTVEYSVVHICEDYGSSWNDNNWLVWPPGLAIRDVVFGSSEGGRTPSTEIEPMFIGYQWYVRGFEDLTAFTDVAHAHRVAGRRSDHPGDVELEERAYAEWHREWAQLWGE